MPLPGRPKSFRVQSGGPPAITSNMCRAAKCADSLNHFWVLDEKYCLLLLRNLCRKAAIYGTSIAAMNRMSSSVETSIETLKLRRMRLQNEISVGSSSECLQRN
jgi:hypothetical protein